MKRSADVLLKDEDDQKYAAVSQGSAQPELSGLTGSQTEEGAEDALADEDDMEEEVVGRIHTSNIYAGKCCDAVADEDGMQEEVVGKVCKQLYMLPCADGLMGCC